MKKLSLTFTFSGAADRVYNLLGISKPELNKVWRASYAALGFLSDFSDVESVMDAGEVDAGGRQALKLFVEVKEAKKGDPFCDATFNWHAVDQTQAAIILASFENQFLKSDIDWH